MQLSELRTNVQNYLLDLPDETQALVDTWINEAIREAVERHNFQFMESEVQVQTSDQTRVLQVKPDDWKESRGEPWVLHQGGDASPIRWAPSESEMIRIYGQAAPAEGSSQPIDEGSPEFILETDSDLEVYPFPNDDSEWDDGNYRLRIPYWAYPAELEDDTDTNWLTQNMAFYVIFYAAAEGFYFNREEQRGNFYAQKAEARYRRGRNTDKRARLPDRLTLYPKRSVYGTHKSRRL